MQGKKKAPTLRMQKINSALQKKISEILQAGNFFPAGALVTVTRVEVTPDMREAEAWISCLNADAEEVLRHIRANLYDIQGEVYRGSTARVTPKVRFRLDTSGEYYDHINEVLKHLDDE